MLNYEQQEQLAASVKQAASQVENLVSAMDRSVSYYLPLHADKWEKFNRLKNVLQLSASGKSTSVPDLYGVVLNTLEFDAGSALEAKKRYRKLAKCHPDHGGSANLFAICDLAYKSRDLRLLDLLIKALYEQISLEDAALIVNSRAYAFIQQQHAMPAFRLLQLDKHSGQNGCIIAARDYAEQMLDNLIEALGIIILKGNN